MNLDQLRAESERALEVAKPVFDMLTRLPTGEYAALLEGLKPRPGDAALAFSGDAAAQLRPFYERLWATPPMALGVAPDQTALRVAAATVDLLRVPNPVGDAFPGGYRRIVEMLVPGRVWVAWKYVRPGSATGMAFDGLVFLDDHWAWFPKPWRGLRIPMN